LLEWRRSQKFGVGRRSFLEVADIVLLATQFGERVSVVALDFDP
jgi:hypothetical protein